MTTYSRSDWGSTLPVGGYPMAKPVGEVYVHHFNSGIQPPATVDSCKSRMRGAQAYHASLGWGDIGYSWCISDAGDVYEGRGWGRTGAHTYGFNSKGYGVCWLGDSNVSTPSRRALEAYALIIREGIAGGWLVVSPTIVAHRDRVPDTACCGDPMYGQLDTIRALVDADYPPPPPAPEPDPTDEEDEMLVTWLIPDGTRYIGDPRTGASRTAQQAFPGGLTGPEIETAVAEMVQSGACKDLGRLGWNSNWVLRTSPTWKVSV